MPAYSGRLELTWTNKDKTLLAHEDGSYEWVDPADYRVAEIRLLHDVASTGEVHGDKSRAADNLLIRGDALHALRALNWLPEFAKAYAGKVRLCYIDPPFNTGQAFRQYDDNLEHSVWLTMLRDRLEQIGPLLAPDATVWVHLDDIEVHRARLVMDEVLGAPNFVGTVIWEKTDSPRMDAAFFSVRHDYILVYGRSELARFNQLIATDEGHYKKVDAEGRRYYLNPLRARGGQGSTREARPTLYFPMIAPDGSRVYPKLPGGGDGAWRWSRSRVERDAHLLEWVRGKAGWTPNYRIYEREHRTRPPETIWPFTEVGSTRTSKSEIKALFGGKVFATPKPERLLQRILHIASDPGDIVLDCFLGSGTTVAVAHKMGRRWVGIEWSPETVSTFAIPRLRKVVVGRDPGGVTEAMGWTAGGGFRALDVAPSMFEALEGRVYLTEWATNGALGEAVAAQFGYHHQADPPFVGRKGRTRLAVVDGLVNEDVVRLLVDALAADERLLACGTAIDPAARKVLRDLRPGSTLRKIPAGLLDEYRVQRRERLQLASWLDWTEWTGEGTFPDAA